jgi:hypothetical protein
MTTLLRSQIDLRIRQERRHADIHGHAAFHPIFNTALNGPVLFLDLGNLLPDLDGNGFFAGQQQAALILPLFDEDLELVADLDLPGRIFVAEFGERDEAFRLVADVDEHGVVAQADDGAHGNLTDIDDGVVVFLLEQLRKAHFLKAGVICRKCGLSSVFCHGCSCGGRCRPFLRVDDERDSAAPLRCGGLCYLPEPFSKDNWFGLKNGIFLPADG